MTIKCSLIMKDGVKIGFKLYAKDYANPTQEEKESLCQPDRKVLGFFMSGAIGIKGTPKSIFNTAEGELGVKMRIVDEKDTYLTPI